MNIQRQEYFSRQISIPDVGTQGIDKLQSSRIAVVGVGGVGSAAAYYLTKSGVGQIRIIDQDIVETSNLHRILGADFSNLYNPKAEALSAVLSRLHPWCKTEPVVETLTANNTKELLQETDLVVDGLDNFRARYILNRYALRTGTPYVFASAIGNQAHLALFNPPVTPCLECVMPGVKDRIQESCEVLGVTPTIVGITGAIAASVAVRWLMGQPTETAGGLLTIDMSGPDFLLSKLSRREECSVCGKLDNREPQDFRVATMVCGERTANVQPVEKLHLDLAKISKKIRPEMLLASSSSVLVFREDDQTVSIFPSGRIIIRGVTREEEALSTAQRIWKELAQQSQPAS